MITPRTTRLFRAADIPAFQRAILHLVSLEDPFALQDCFVLVPSEAAGDQLKRTFEGARLGRAGDRVRALLFPRIVTRAGWLDALHQRLPGAPGRLSDIEREVLLRTGARQVAAGDADAPFRLRPGLLAEMLRFYDELQRRGVSVDTFERRIGGDLERDALIDRGAERLLRQTRFLAGAFRAYEALRDRTGALDEHTLRARLMVSPLERPAGRVIVTIGERSVDPAGLWPADFDLLTRLPGLASIDVVSTRAMLGAGLLERLHELLPGFEEADIEEAGDPVVATPALAAGADGRPFSRQRDREEELTAAAARIRRSGVVPLERTAVVFKTPLPYVYLAPEVFREAGIPYQTYDSLPLAAEPFAAAVDVLFEFVLSNFNRESAVALLSSPHFAWIPDDPLARDEIGALNRSLSDAGHVGGIEGLRAVRGRGARAAGAAATAAGLLAPLTDPRPPAEQLDLILQVLARYGAPESPDDLLRERHLRARGAIVGAIQQLRNAHRDFDEVAVGLDETAAIVRRWIEGQTFSPRAGTVGVQLLDAQAARYGEFDRVFLVGLVEGEWPQRSTRSIFYPASLLGQVDWPDGRRALAGERATFEDLLRLARHEVHVSTFELENDAIVGPSVLLEGIDRLGLGTAAGEQGEGLLTREATVGTVSADAPAEGTRAAWLALRAGRSGLQDAAYHGAAKPFRPRAFSVSSLERYLQCPFRYFAERVLELEEDPDDETTLGPREVGIFVHQVFQAFFEAWGALGRLAITPAALDEARRVFREVAERHLERLPDGEAAVHRARLLGSAVDEGLAEAVFQAEAEWDTPVVRRLLEHSFDGEFDLQTPEGPRRVALRGKADRIDLLADGTFRIIDYKLTRAPERKLALQLPIYSVCAAQQLRAETGDAWEPGQAGYIAFGQERRFVPMLARGKAMDATLLDAQARLMNAVDRIERGEFPPTPADIMMCTRCPHAAVCRKDYVDV